MQNFDLIIVGAGYAGLTCAKAAASRGVKTLVIDRKKFAGQHPHTTGIIVKEAADAWDIPREYTRVLPGVRIYSPGFHTLDLKSPGYFFLAADVPAIMRWLAETALSAGVEILWNVPFKGADLENGTYVLHDLNLTCSFIVGADGAKSKVARYFNLGQNKKFLYGLEVELPPSDIFNPEFMHCFLDADLAPGYLAWVVPGKGIVQAGLATHKPDKAHLHDFLEKMTDKFNIQKKSIIGRRAGVIPAG